MLKKQAELPSRTQKASAQQRIKIIGQLVAKLNGLGTFARSPNF